MASKKNTADYEQLGKALAALVETGYVNKRQLYKVSFIKGLFSGLGGVIGATILITILLWALSLFSNIPVLGRLADRFNSTIQTSVNKQ